MFNETCRPQLLNFWDGALIEEGVDGILDLPLGSGEEVYGLGLGGGGSVSEVFDELGLFFGVVVAFFLSLGIRYHLVGYASIFDKWL